jgi:hypothetical protein
LLLELRHTLIPGRVNSVRSQLAERSARFDGLAVPTGVFA